MGCDADEREYQVGWSGDAGSGALAVLAVQVLAGEACPARALPVIARPQIRSVSPGTGPAGTRVTITGSGFTRVSAVRFGRVAAVFTVRPRSKITTVVPAMPSSAVPVQVTTGAGSARSRARFAVTAAVRLSPASGPPGSAVRVSGTGFGVREDADIFTGDTDAAAAAVSTAAGSFGPVTVTIPSAAVPGTCPISAKGRDSGPSAQAAVTVNTNWAQFRYSESRTGSNPHENVLAAANVAQLVKDWSSGTRWFVQSSPAVVNGVVYAGSDDHKVYALNAATGSRRWTFTTADTVESIPAVTGGVVYVGSFDHNVYALNAATGTVINTRADAVITTVDLTDSEPGGIAVNPRADRIYVTDDNFPGESFSVIDGRTSTVTATIPLDREAFGVGQPARQHHLRHRSGP